MKIKLSELRTSVRETFQKMCEDYEVGSDDELDLDNPVIIWNNSYDMDDQETTTKLANGQINFNLPPEDAEKDKKHGDDEPLQMKLKSMIPGMYQEGKTDSNGNSFEWAIAHYAKKNAKNKKLKKKTK